MVVTSVIVVASLTALFTETLRASFVTASVGLTLIAAAEALILLLGIGQMDCLILITAASSGRAFVTVITPRFTVSAVIDDAYNAKTGYDIPIHVDAASGGFILPFLYPEKKW